MPSAAKIEWPQGNPLFEVQWRAVAESLTGNGILGTTDLLVSATGTNLEIEVSTGSAWYEGSEYTLSSSQTFTLSSGDSNDRWDTVYFDTATTSAGVREGTPAVSPEPPDVQGDELLLAVVYVPANATDVPDQDVLNWRAEFTNHAGKINYDDSTGQFNVDTVEDALDELSEAAQITSYPISREGIDDEKITTTVTSTSYTTQDEEAIFVDTAAIGSTATITLASADVSDGNTIVVSDVAGNASSNNIEIVTESSETIGGDTTDTIRVDGGSRTFTSDGTNWAIGGGGGEFDGELFQSDLTAESGAITVFDNTDNHVPRSSVDDEKDVYNMTTSSYTTQNEEVVFVDTSSISATSTVTLATADAESGNTIVVSDKTGSATDYPITVKTEGSETIAGSSTKEITTDGGALVFTSDGTNWALGGGGGNGGPLITNVTTVSADYSVTTDDSLIIVNNNGGEITLTMDDAAYADNKEYYIKVLDDTEINIQSSDRAIDGWDLSQGTSQHSFEGIGNTQQIICTNGQYYTGGTGQIHEFRSMTSQSGTNQLNSADPLNSTQSHGYSVTYKPPLLGNATSNTNSSIQVVDAGSKLSLSGTGSVNSWADGDDVVVATEYVPEDAEIALYSVSLTGGDGSKLPSDVDITIGFINSTGGYSQKEVFASTPLDDNAGGEHIGYTPDRDATSFNMGDYVQTPRNVAIVLVNNSGSTIDARYEVNAEMSYMNYGQATNLYP